MTRSLLAIVSIVITTAASAGTMPLAKPLATRPAPRQDLVSANLSKIVFWHVPDRSGDKPNHRTAD